MFVLMFFRGFSLLEELVVSVVSIDSLQHGLPSSEGAGHFRL